MICLSLTRETISEALDDVRRNLQWIDLVELRADLLAHLDPQALSSFPAELAKVAATATGERRIGCIFTLRRGIDGGGFEGEEADRLKLIRDVLSGGSSAEADGPASNDARFDYVDLELDLERNEAGQALRRQAQTAGIRVIRSYHEFTGVPGQLESRYEELCRREEEIPKLAAAPRNTAELLRLIELLQNGAGRDRIIVGMGTVGFPTRVLAPVLGGYLSYTSADHDDAVAAAPGHVGPRRLAETYRYRSMSETTAVFGIIGKPVMHSSSPAFHNRHFTEKNLDAVYVPFEVDELDPFFELAELLEIRGLSVTVPHKESVISYLHEVDESVVPVGACNTVLVSKNRRRRGLNTDVTGFMLPLERAIGASGPEAFDGMRATVVGAGGAARAVVFGLLRAGVRLCIVNRTVERAERMGAEIAGALGVERPLAAALDSRSRETIEEYGSLIVQTTSVGMEPNVDEDPLPFYEFRGHEIACDIIYAPETTRFLQRAQAAGCVTISGTQMFEEQGLAQAAYFEHIV
ncbi:MAG: type I 3-dehydroquinate dehydratase [Spirochaetota bacterium]